MMGGQVTNNPIYSGALGEYNGCILRSSQDVATGVSESTGLALTSVHRAVLLGAQAAMIAYGQQNNPGQGKYRWNEELIDSSVAAQAANDNWKNCWEALRAA